MRGQQRVQRVHVQLAQLRVRRARAQAAPRRARAAPPRAARHHPPAAEPGHTHIYITITILYILPIFRVSPPPWIS